MSALQERGCKLHSAQIRMIEPDGSHSCEPYQFNCKSLTSQDATASCAFSHLAMKGFETVPMIKALADLLKDNPYRFKYLLRQLEFNVCDRYPTRQRDWHKAMQLEIIDRSLGSEDDYMYQRLMLNAILSGVDLHEPMQDRFNYITDEGDDFLGP